MRVEPDCPMTSSQVQRTGLPRTVLFVDVCGSTKLYETLGNARAQAVIARMLTVLSDSATRHLGTIVKTIGDEVMCTFSSAREAAAAAVDMQRSIKEATATPEMGIKSLAVRVGFHSGPVISHAEDVFGDTVNVAARVVAHAKPGQILVAKQTVRRLPMEEGSVRFVGSTQVKGKNAPIELFEIVWDRENLTMVKDVFETKMSNTRLTATFGATTIEMGPARPVLHMGRGPENEFAVPDPMASRVHARIEYRRDRFLLIDQSLNGTYLQMHGMKEVALRRDETVLERSGIISLGKSVAENRESCLEFSVQRGNSQVASRALMRKGPIP
jgi:adenylate cyclase